MDLKEVINLPVKIVHYTLFLKGITPQLKDAKPLTCVGSIRVTAILGTLLASECKINLDGEDCLSWLTRGGYWEVPAFVTAVRKLIRSRILSVAENAIKRGNVLTLTTVDFVGGSKYDSDTFSSLSLSVLDEIKGASTYRRRRHG